MKSRGVHALTPAFDPFDARHDSDVCLHATDDLLEMASDHTGEGVTKMEFRAIEALG